MFYIRESFAQDIKPEDELREALQVASGFLDGTT